MERVMKWLTGRGNNRHSGQPAGTVVREVAFRPVLEGSMLMQTEERRRLVRMLADNSPLSQSVTEAWWLKPAQTMLERVQDCPAAWKGAYSSPVPHPKSSRHRPRAGSARYSGQACFIICPG